MIEVAGKITWQRIRGVIFDLDGTLYDQRRLRVRILAELVVYLARHPNRWRYVLALIRYRKLRERLADLGAKNVDRLQYRLVARSFGLPESLIVAFIDEWIERRPLPHLRAARLSGVIEFFDMLRTHNIRIGVLSDYPVADKLKALDLSADAVCYSLEGTGGYLKPHPAGLRLMLERLGLQSSDCLLIGDRIERDGACAAALNMPFLHRRGARFFDDLRGDCKASLFMPTRG